MSSRILLFFKIYLFFIVVFILQKPMFMLYEYSMSFEYSFIDWIKAILYGFRLDLSTAGYLTILPGIFLIISVWVPNTVLETLLKYYTYFITALICLIFIPDLELYKHWGFRINKVCLFYLNDPKTAAASVTFGMAALGLLLFAVYYFALNYCFKKTILVFTHTLPTAKSKFLSSIVLFLISGALILPIRGGISQATMNIGQAYHSNDLFLNHCAVNPQFSLFASVLEDEDFRTHYRFMPAEEAERIFDTLTDKHTPSDSIPALLKDKRPNIIVVVLESFMASVVQAYGGEDIAPNLSKIANEGIAFTNFFANGVRTDKGLVAVLSGYPAQPNTSIMRYPSKTQSLPSLMKTFKENGYRTAFYYGGDIDFFNMRSYLRGQDVENIISFENFPLNEQLQKVQWGIPDNLLFNKVLNDLDNKPATPFFDVILTLSSHEPYDVPTKKYAEPYFNSIAFADSCLGVFVNKFKESALWKNTLILFVADHTKKYNHSMQNTEVVLSHIPFVWSGGAIVQPMQIDTLGSQIDIAATLLSQVGIDAKDFKFSKDMLSPNTPKFAFFAFSDGFVFTEEERRAAYDNTARIAIKGSDNVQELHKGQAFLQTLFNDLGNR